MGCCTLIVPRDLLPTMHPLLQRAPRHSNIWAERGAQAERWPARGHTNWQHQTEAVQEFCILTHTSVLSPGFLLCEKHPLLYPPESVIIYIFI